MRDEPFQEIDLFSYPENHYSDNSCLQVPLSPHQFRSSIPPANQQLNTKRYSEYNISRVSAYAGHNVPILPDYVQPSPYGIQCTIATNLRTLLPRSQKTYLRKSFLLRFSPIFSGSDSYYQFFHRAVLLP
jgi:hypothetical protein